MKYLFFLLCFMPGLSVSDYLDCPCKVVKVTDGDTVHVLDQSTVKHKIRLGGIDAPEKKQAFGKKSTQNLASLVAGKQVEVEYDKRDRYGRIIGKLIKDGKDINLLQIKHGYAWHYKYYQKDQTRLDRDLYSSAEIEAREKRLGLWVEAAIPPWEFRRKDTQETTNTGCNIKGNISSNGNRIYHLPGTTWYGRTKINESKGERWFCSEEEARAAGWRVPLN